MIANCSTQILDLDAPVENTKAARMQALCFFYIFLWTVVPILAIGTIWRVLALLAFVIWYSIAITRGFVVTTPVSRAIGCAIFFITVNLLIDFRFVTISRGINLAMLAIAVMMFTFYRKHPTELSRLLPWVLVALAIFNFRTAFALKENEHLSRYIVRNSKIAFELQQQGIGGYTLIYSQVCTFPAIFSWCRHVLTETKDKVLWALSLAWIASYLFFLVKASYSIAIFATAVSLFFIYTKKRFTMGQSALVMVLIFVGILVAIAALQPFRELLFDLFRDTTIEKKLHDFSMMNNLEVNDRFGYRDYGSINVRLERYLWSLGTMLQFPIIGSLCFPAMIGSHSAILDTFARYGWLGGWLFCGVIFSVPLTFKNYVRNKPRLVPVVNAMFVVILFVGLLNTLPFEVAFNLVILNGIFMFELIRIDNAKSSRMPLNIQHL